MVTEMVWLGEGVYKKWSVFDQVLQAQREGSRNTITSKPPKSYESPSQGKGEQAGRGRGFVGVGGQDELECRSYKLGVRTRADAPYDLDDVGGPPQKQLCATKTRNNGSEWVENDDQVGKQGRMSEFQKKLAMYRANK